MAKQRLLMVADEMSEYISDGFANLAAQTQSFMNPDAAMRIHIMDAVDDDGLLAICYTTLFGNCSFDALAQWLDTFEEKPDWQVVYEACESSTNQRKWLSFVVYRYYDNSIGEAIWNNQHTEFGHHFLALNSGAL